MGIVVEPWKTPALSIPCRPETCDGNAIPGISPTYESLSKIADLGLPPETAAAFCGATSVSHATASFHNTGTIANGGGFSNWDKLQPGLAGQHHAVDQCDLSGHEQFDQVPGGLCGHRLHGPLSRDEAAYQRAMSMGTPCFYGFAFYLQSAWDFSGSQQYQLFQMIADFTNDSDNNCGEDWQPSAMIWVSGSQLASRRNYGSDECHRTTQEYTGLAGVSAGVWHRIVTQAHWTNDSTGYYKVWFDGTKVLELLNQAVTVNRPTQYCMDVGIYANSWHDQGFRHRFHRAHRVVRQGRQGHGVCGCRSRAVVRQVV